MTKHLTNSSKAGWIKSCVVIAAIGLVFAGIKLSAAPSKEEAKSAPKSGKASAERVIPIIASKIQNGTVRNLIKTSGEIIPSLGVDLNPEASGKILDIYVDVGSRVTKGQKLAQIDNMIQTARLQEAAAAVKVAESAVKLQAVMVENSKTKLTSAKASLVAAESALKNVSITRARQEKLLAEGAISRQSVDDVIAQYDAASARFTGAESELKLSQDAISTAKMTLEMRKAELLRANAGYNSAKVTLDNTSVEAPFDGVITARFADPGAMASVGAPLFRVEQNKPVKLICNLPEKDLYAINLDTTRPFINVDAISSAVEGKIRAVYPSVDPRSRTGRIELLIDNKEGSIMSGMFANVDFILETHSNVPCVNIDSVLRYEGKTYVYLVKDGKAVRKEFKAGIIEGNTYEVKSGLKAGDIIIAAGIEFIREGSNVAVANGDSIK